MAFSSGFAQSPVFVQPHDANPLGRGVSTRNCFAVNEDRRLIQPSRSSSSAVAPSSAFGPSSGGGGSSLFGPSPIAFRPSSGFGTFGNPSPSAFGQSSGGGNNFFGNRSASAFGASSPFSQVQKLSHSEFGFGSGASPGFAPTIAYEGNGEYTRLMSVSAMPDHSHTSVEEMRFRSQSSGASLFGQPSTNPSSTSLFGNPTTGPTPAPSRGFFGGVPKQPTAPGPFEFGTATDVRNGDQTQQAAPFGAPGKQSSGFSSFATQGGAIFGGSQPNKTVTGVFGGSFGASKDSVNPFGPTSAIQGASVFGGSSSEKPVATTSIFSTNTQATGFGVSQSLNSSARQGESSNDGQTSQASPLFCWNISQKPTQSTAMSFSFGGLRSDTDSSRTTIFGNQTEQTSRNSIDNAANTVGCAIRSDAFGPVQAEPTIRFGSLTSLPSSTSFANPAQQSSTGESSAGMFDGGDVESVIDGNGTRDAGHIQLPTAESQSLALRSPGPAAKVKGSRATAFVQRAGTSFNQSFVAMGQRSFVTSTTPASRTILSSNGASPSEKTIIGRCDTDDAAKSDDFHLRSTIFEKSVPTAASSVLTGIESPGFSGEAISEISHEQPIAEREPNKEYNPSDANLDEYDL